MSLDLSGMNRNYNQHNAAQITAKVYNTVAGDSYQTNHTNEDFSFAAMLTKEEDSKYSKVTVTDNIALIEKQMGQNATTSFMHDGVPVSIETNSLLGNKITIGGSDNPEWITVNTSVGAVNIDMNDLSSLGKCMDLFSPEDQKKILEGITKYKMAKHAEAELDDNEDKVLNSLQSEE